MSYTFTTDIGDGVKTTFPFSFAGQDEGYISPSNVMVFVAGVSVPFTINLTDPNKVVITTAPALGAEVLIRRIMPKDVPYADFSRGNPFSQDTLNNTNLQQLYVVQELLDGFLPTGFYFKQDVNMGGHKLTNLNEGTQHGDSVRYEQWKNHDDRIASLETGIEDLPIGSFQDGATIKSNNQSLLDKSTIPNQLYRWDGPFASGGKVVPAGSTPATTGGTGVGKWIGVGDAALRSQLQSKTGLDLIGEANYADIRALNGAEVKIACYGRTHVLDGASGVFRVDTSDTTSADNDCTILIDAIGRRWKRDYNILDGILVDWAGADPSGGVDSSSAFQKAVLAGNGIRLRGDYVVNSPVIIASDTSFFIKGTSRRKDTITKTNLSAPNITRSYDGVPFAYNTPCIFAFVANDDSSVRHVLVENIETIGAEGDNTQVHFFAPRATYCVFRGLLSTHGKSFWESTSNGFINAFYDVRTALMSKHWVVKNSNAYTLVNVYSNGNAVAGDSIAFEFTDTNASFTSCDCDGLNSGWVADGHSNLEVVGSNSEARIRIFNASGNASINIHGGRHALTVIASQQSKEAAIYRAEGNGRVNVIGAKAHKFVFNATPSNKLLSIVTGSGVVNLSNLQLAIGSESAAASFTYQDVFIGQSGLINIVDGGAVVSKVAASLPVEVFDYTLSRKLNKVIDFSTSAVQNVLTFSTIAYNQMLLANIEMLYRATGENGVLSVGGVATCKIATSYRAQNTKDLQTTKVAISPDSGAATIEFSVINNGANVSLVATASDTRTGLCSFMFDVEAVVSNASRTSTLVSVS